MNVDGTGNILLNFEKLLTAVLILVKKQDLHLILHSSNITLILRSCYIQVNPLTLLYFHIYLYKNTVYKYLSLLCVNYIVATWHVCTHIYIHIHIKN